MVDTGYGHEQDIVLSYTISFLDDTLALSVGLAGYLYPFASDNAADDARKPGAGAACPLYLEPGLGLAYNGPVDVGINLSYFAAVQEAIADYRYLYINPHVGKTFEISDSFSMRINLSYGYKVFNDPEKMKDNAHDIRFDYELSIAIAKSFVIVPNAHLAWSNFAGKTAGDEYMAYGGVRLGYDF